MSSITIEDAPSVVAASKCWLHRRSPMKFHERSDGTRPRRMSHPDECGWCAYPPDVLIEAITEFVRDRDDLIAAFERLPFPTQQSLVLKAQGFESRGVRTTRERAETLAF